MAPRRELPPLVLKIIADNKDALQGLRDVARAAVDMAKDVKKAFDSIRKSREKGEKDSDKGARKRSRRRNQEEIKEARELATTKEAIHAQHLIRMARMNDAYLARMRQQSRGLSTQGRGLITQNRGLGPGYPPQNRPSYYRFGRITGHVPPRLTYNGGGSGGSGGDGNPGGPAGEDDGNPISRRERNRRNREIDRAYRQRREAEDRQDRENQARARRAAASIRRYRRQAADERMDYVRRSQETINNIREWGDRIRREHDREDARQLRRQRQRQVRRLRAQRENSLMARAGRAMQGMDAGNMMGARADVYMHRQALDTIGRGIVNFMQPYAEVENATVAMKVFTGSLETAKATVAELHQYAIESPYSLPGVLEASKLLMKYGTDAKQAVEYTKMLGDVAGGDSDKLKLLGLALGQMKGIGTVQGQEVRQMVNAGFNPLQVAAKEMAGGDGASEEAIAKQMQVLMDKMRRRQVDWKLVVAALKTATSKGGDFAGMADAQSKTIQGLTNQIMETIGLLKKEIAETFAEDLRLLLKEVLRYATALVTWVQKNKDLVKSFVYAGIQLGKFIIFLHMFGFALAWCRWMFGTVIAVLGFFGGALRLAGGLVMALRSSLLLLFPTLSWLRMSFIATWLSALGPIAAVIAAVMVLYLVLAGLTHEGGFAGLVGDWIKALYGFIGFFYNFSHNINNIWKFMMQNLVLMLIDGVLQITHQFIMLGKLAAQVVDSITGTQLRAAIDATIVGIRSMAGTNGQYDMSMLKFNTPSMEDMTGVSALKKMLQPHLPKDKEYVIPDKPDVDWNSYLGNGNGSDGPAAMAPDHAIRGSSDHAVRMYKFGEQARAAASGGGEKSHEKKTEDLLGLIEKNTRGATNPNAILEMADL